MIEEKKLAISEKKKKEQEEKELEKKKLEEWEQHLMDGYRDRTSRNPNDEKQRTGK